VKKRIGRPRVIPKQSKKLKYMYIICVNFHGVDTLKFGISNNVWRRMREYNNSNTNGFLKNILNVYKCSNPKRLEQILKFFLPQFIPSVAKMEYYEMEHYEFIRDKMIYLAHLFDYKLEEIDYYNQCQSEIEKNELKLLKK
jgi:hypothetical protein